MSDIIKSLDTHNSHTNFERYAFKFDKSFFLVSNGTLVLKVVCQMFKRMKYLYYCCEWIISPQTHMLKS